MRVREDSPLVPTAPAVYATRRDFLRRAGALLASCSALGGAAGRACDDIAPVDHGAPNSWAEITRYNNYYEFSTNKEVIHVLARELTTTPWQVTVDGEVERPLTLDVDELARRWPAEERTYSLRCVEGWSMVIPWSGFPLCKLLQQVSPLSSARYVRFESLLRPAEMIGQRQPTLPWPYTEGLRIDEAAHPLTLLATGLYGKPLPNQNGAPLRLVVPWKYGFKSIKAVTRITLTRERPVSSWERASPGEYGFFGNVNPAVAHPRWSQRSEVRIGELRKRETLPFNGYADQVAALYAGMDLNAHY